jgi:hypothetical protein
MSLFGCRPAAVVVQPSMETASREAAVVQQFRENKSSNIVNFLKSLEF